MTVMIDLPASKAQKLEKIAHKIGMSTEDFTARLVECLLDLSDSEVDEWIETFEILSDEEFARKLKHSIKEAEQGNVADWKDVKGKLGIE